MSAIMHVTLRFLPFLFAATLAAVPPMKTAWEAPLPPGRETDGIALNKAAGETTAAKLDMVKGAKGELQPQNFPDLKSKVPHEGIFRVLLKKEDMVLPPDMGGAGPFHVFRSGGAYYLLTRRNFALLFGPLTSKEEVLPFVRTFDKLFTNPFSDVVTSAKEAKGFQKVPPPAVTEITETGDGWDVKLILYSGHRVRAFYEEKLRVLRDGTVEVKEKTKMLKEIGPGYMF